MIIWRSLQLLLNLPIQHLLEAILSVENIDESFHVFISLRNRISHSSLVDECSVLLFGTLGFRCFEVRFVELDCFVATALLFVQLGEVVRTVGLGILDLQFFRQLVIVVEMVLSKFDLLHFQVALCQ